MQISNVKYKNIRGNSNTDIAVSFKCSKDKPCQNITVEDINLWPYAREGRKLRNFCFEVNGSSHGKQIPPSCIPPRAFSATPLLP